MKNIFWKNQALSVKIILNTFFFKKKKKWNQWDKRRKWYQLCVTSLIHTQSQGAREEGHPFYWAPTMNQALLLTSTYLMIIWGIESYIWKEGRNWLGIEESEGKKEERFLKSTFFFSFLTDKQYNIIYKINFYQFNHF